MDAISFSYDGRECKGEVVISITEEPHYYWCFISEPDLIEELGDCIAFEKKEGVIVPTTFYPHKYNALMNNIQNAITQYLAANVTNLTR